MYKILSLDGGGSWSLIQLLTLQDRYPGKRGHEILQDFDMVIANSGGSIVLAALVEDWTIDKALELFHKRETREKIFSRNSYRERFFPTDILGLFTSFGPKYSAKRKGEAFRELFKQSDKRQMTELPEFVGNNNLKIIVATYDALNNRAKFFKSFGSGAHYDSVRLTQAIHGSSNAPIQYFDFPARFKAKNSGVYFELWDGALGGFNNPIAAGIIEAVKCGVPKKDIVVVSLGTSNKLMSMEDKDEFYKVKQIAIKERHKKYLVWRLKYPLKFFKASILNQAKTILYEPPDWSNYVAYMFLYGEAYTTGDHEAHTSRFIRLSPLLHVDAAAPEATANLVSTLYKMDMNLTLDAEIAKVGECYAQWKAGQIKNQTIEFMVTRQNEIISTIGHQTYQEAYDAWMRI
ncbi:patatin-like phospholipase family protein [Flavobacterium sp.]|uniref:patatin-like phospholipase family protein n=1 Tax=Flavobacterium sp. TaxID=239 RepID=UPI0026078204|nr:patatin-like phospholipase family protein [Flavobacterium sp.]